MIELQGEGQSQDDRLQFAQSGAVEAIMLGATAAITALTDMANGKRDATDQAIDAARVVLNVYLRLAQREVVT